MSTQLLSKIAMSDRHGEDSPYFDGWKAYDNNPFHPTQNADGVIQMGLAENQVYIYLCILTSLAINYLFMAWININTKLKAVYIYTRTHNFIALTAAHINLVMRSFASIWSRSGFWKTLKRQFALPLESASSRILPSFRTIMACPSSDK